MLIIITAVKQGEWKLKNTLQVVKLNEPLARKTTERYHLTKKTPSPISLKLQYLKIPKRGPSMYKPLQIQSPQNRNAKNRLLIHPSEYGPPWGLVFGICPRIQIKTKQKRVNFLPTTS